MFYKATKILTREALFSNRFLSILQTNICTIIIIIEKKYESFFNIKTCYSKKFKRKKLVLNIYYKVFGVVAPKIKFFFWRTVCLTFASKNCAFWY